MRVQLFRGGLGSVALKVSNILLGLALAVALPRILGAENYGIYTYVFALISLLAVPAQFGLPNVLVRETARSRVTSSWGAMRGIWRWAWQVTSLVSVAIGVVVGAVAWLLADRFTSLELTTLAWGLLLVPLIALGKLRGAALCGLGQVVVGQLPEIVVRPGLYLLLILGAQLLFPDAFLDVADAMALHCLAAGGALLTVAMLLWRRRPAPLALKPAPEYHARTWMAAALPLALVSAVHLINQYTDVLMLGLLRDAEEVGVYQVAVSGGMLVTFALGAVATVASPQFARLHAERDWQGLQAVVTMTSRFVLLLTIPVVLVFVFGGEFILGRVFGPEYTEAHAALAFLALGQLMNATTGAVGVLLMMTGHERETARGVAVGAGLNVVLNLALIPPLGMDGAAIATATSTVTWNLLLWRAARVRLRIETMAVPLLRMRDRRDD